MPERVEMRIYGSAQLHAVEIEPGDCPHCAFVQQHVDPNPGAVVFVCAGAGDDDMRRVQAVITFASMTGLVCERVTAEQVEGELRALSVGSA